MTNRNSSLILIAALSVGCATSPAATRSPGTAAPSQAPPPPPAAAVAQPAALNPVGTFEYTATLPDGSQTSGMFTITGSAGSYTGTITSAAAGESPIANIAVDGQMLMFTTVIPDGTVAMTLTFTGDSFAGKWAVQGAEGPITGRRR